MDVRALTVRSGGKALQLRCDVTVETQNYTGTVPALWDTGATGSAISHEVVNNFHPTPFGKEIISTPTGTKEVDTYCIDVHLPNGVNFDGLIVTESEIGTQGLGLLIGMDIIGSGDFAVTNLNGNTIFTYRYPASGVIDFVKEANIQRIIGPKHGKGKRKRK